MILNIGATTTKLGSLFQICLRNINGFLISYHCL